MDTVRRIGSNDRSTRVMAELGMTRSEQDCVLMMQGSDEVKTVVVFETDGAHIKRYDTCIPKIMGVRHTGIVPM